MSHVCGQVVRDSPQHFKETCTRLMNDLEQATKLARTVAQKVSGKLDALDHEINALNTQAASLRASNQGKAKKLQKRASILMGGGPRVKMVEIKERVDKDLSRMLAMLEEDKLGAMTMARCCMREGQLCYASQEDVDALGALINRRLNNPDFDVGEVYK